MGAKIIPEKYNTKRHVKEEKATLTMSDPQKISYRQLRDAYDPSEISFSGLKSLSSILEHVLRMGSFEEKCEKTPRKTEHCALIFFKIMEFFLEHIFMHLPGVKNNLVF